LLQVVTICFTRFKCQPFVSVDRQHRFISLSMNLHFCGSG